MNETDDARTLITPNKKHSTDALNDEPSDLFTRRVTLSEHAKQFHFSARDTCTHSWLSIVECILQTFARLCAPRFAYQHEHVNIRTEQPRFHLRAKTMYASTPATASKTYTIMLEPPADAPPPSADSADSGVCPCVAD